DAQAELLLEQLNIWKIPLLKIDENATINNKRKIKRLVTVANKSDTQNAASGLKALMSTYGNVYHIASISSNTKEGIEDLRRLIFEVSGIIRAYSKEPGKDPDMKAPFTIPAGSTVIELAQIIHKDFATNLKYACVWGSSKFQGQKVHKDHILKDKDIVEFHV
ncbi:MAG: TGS domain-containing protein, partial [Thermodesulfovibrionales bacterium]